MSNFWTRRKRFGPFVGTLETIIPLNASTVFRYYLVIIAALSLETCEKVEVFVGVVNILTLLFFSPVQKPLIIALTAIPVRYLLTSKKLKKKCEINAITLRRSIKLFV